MEILQIRSLYALINNKCLHICFYIKCLTSDDAFTKVSKKSICYDNKVYIYISYLSLKY